jgi:ligand-binding sensor domain-containing protein
MKKFSVICILFFCLIFSVFSQNVNGQSFWSEYVSRNWTAAEGLPGNTITDIIQDDKGYIYIGTYDGLVRFDGVNFYVMNKASIPEFNCGYPWNFSKVPEI